MRYELEISEKLEKVFNKLKKRDKLRAEMVKRKIKMILENLFIGKPLTSNMAGIRRVHIKPFVLTYEILESEKIIRLLDYEHHDSIY